MYLINRISTFETSFMVIKMESVHLKQIYIRLKFGMANLINNYILKAKNSTFYEFSTLIVFYL